MKLATGKTVFVHTSLPEPVLHWRQQEGKFQQTRMVCAGHGRIRGECCWVAQDFGKADQVLEFFVAGAEAGRDPASGHYSVGIDRVFLQEGELFNYYPASLVAPPCRDYAPGDPPVLESRILGEKRPYRVFLPRGYHQHLQRHYPVLYVQDGQNILEWGPYGSWQAEGTLRQLTSEGSVREIIVVAVDNTPRRLQDYVAPDDGGKANRYARFLRTEFKPLIDGRYRTLPAREFTAALGSSAGGVASLYLGWDHFDVFARVGAMSGSWWLARFPGRVRRETRRPIRIYLDSGDQGGAYRDGYHATRALFRSLLSKRYRPETDLQYRVGQGHAHNEGAWAARLPQALRFLFPACEEPSGFLSQPDSWQPVLGRFQRFIPGRIALPLPESA
ncbi:MAG: alpha/beta hydrolase [Armatimonadetes bacterium]|nr:alpha/beta hydrolase [Armatimonadota bacterium]